MKKGAVIMLMTLVCFAYRGHTQQASSHSEGVTFGLRFGVNLNSITGKDSEGKSLNKDWKVGAGIGVNVEIPIAPSLYFQPGLLVSIKGTKSTETVSSQTVTATTYLTYVEVPLNFLYKPVVGSGSMLVGIGPYAAYAVIGKFKTDPGSNETIKFKNTVHNTDPDVPYLKPFDAGVNILIGYQFRNRVSVQLNGQLGLTTINPKYVDEPSDKSSYKNIGIGISLGYRFHPRK